MCGGMGLGMISVVHYLYYLHYRIANQGRLRQAALVVDRHQDSYTIHGDIEVYAEPAAEIGELQKVVTGI